LKNHSLVGFLSLLNGFIDPAELGGTSSTVLPPLLADGDIARPQGGRGELEKNSLVNAEKFPGKSRGPVDQVAPSQVPIVPAAVSANGASPVSAPGVAPVSLRSNIRDAILPGDASAPPPAHNPPVERSEHLAFAIRLTKEDVAAESSLIPPRPAGRASDKVPGAPTEPTASGRPGSDSSVPGSRVDMSAETTAPSEVSPGLSPNRSLVEPASSLAPANASVPSGIFNRSNPPSAARPAPAPANAKSGDRPESLQPVRPTRESSTSAPDQDASREVNASAGNFNRPADGASGDHNRIVISTTDASRTGAPPVELPKSSGFGDPLSAMPALPQTARTPDHPAARSSQDSTVGKPAPRPQPTFSSGQRNIEESPTSGQGEGNAGERNDSGADSKAGGDCVARNPRPVRRMFPRKTG
jgi:hypothetical protein